MIQFEYMKGGGNQTYKQRYVWTDSGTCSIAYLRKGRYCKTCGKRGRFLVNTGRKEWQHLGCHVTQIKP
jgi:hypothetical protein